jgi:NDP-sugar pyrophosphorylase family protein
MRALVMAAGLGTRLRPLTDRMPKPLVPLLGQPMIQYVLGHLAKNGIKEALVNIHYLPGQMQEFVAEWNKKNKAPELFIQDESKMILGSGGAIAQGASWLFEKENTALICNSDVIASPDLGLLRKKHQELAAEKSVECTLAVTPHPEAGKKYTGLRVENGLITAFENNVAANEGLLIFPGYYLLEKSALKRMPRAGTDFSIAEKVWKPQVADKKLGAWLYEKEYLDLGTPEDLRAAEKFLKSKNP